MKPRGLAEDLADLRLGHAVIHDEVESDLGQRETQLVGRALQRAGLAREIGAQIDDGNGLRRRVHSAACGYTAS